MSDIEPIPLPPGDAYALLSKPTAQLTDAEITLIAQDLRAKRQKFLQGKPDKAPAARKPKVELDQSPEAKAARTASLENDLDSLLDL